MKGPVYAILFVLILASCSIWLVSVYRENREREKTRLNVRKMALSIRLEPQQEEEIFELECNRKLRIKELQDSLKNNQAGLKQALSNLTAIHQKKIEMLLDSQQCVKYQKYRQALARKKVRNLKLFRKRK